MTPFSNLSESQVDLLKEVGNIGSGNAATSLSMLIGDKNDMKIPTVRIVGYDEMMDLVGGPDALITAIFLRIEGDTPGNMFFRSEEHTSEVQSRGHLVCRLLLEKKKHNFNSHI